MAPSCTHHPDAEADSTCGACLRPICRVCMLHHQYVVVCPACLPGLRKRRALLAAAKITGGTIALAGLCAAIWYYSGRDPKIDKLRDELAKEPCDRGKIIDLGEALLDKGDNRRALEAAAAFFQRCGDYPRLRWITYESHKRLSELDAAIAEATKLIQREPRDHDYWVWRGLVHETKSDWARAISDYRQALSLEPRLDGVPFNLADIYERLGRACEAIFPLEQFLHYNPKIDDPDEVRRRIMSLYDSGRCDDYAGKGRALIEFNPAAGAIIAIATINGRHKGRFLVDTGASFVTLTPELAEAVGARSQEQEILVQTANGPASAKPITLDGLALQGASASRVSAVIMKRTPEGVDGLLGLSFLSRFDIKVSRREGRLELIARAREDRP